MTSGKEMCTGDLVPFVADFRGRVMVKRFGVFCRWLQEKRCVQEIWCLLLLTSVELLCSRVLAPFVADFRKRVMYRGFACLLLLTSEEELCFIFLDFFHERLAQIYHIGVHLHQTDLFEVWTTISFPLALSCSAFGKCLPVDPLKWPPSLWSLVICMCVVNKYD